MYVAPDKNIEAMFQSFILSIKKFALSQLRKIFMPTFLYKIYGGKEEKTSP